MRKLACFTPLALVTMKLFVRKANFYLRIVKNMLGLKHTEESNAKNRAAHLGKSFNKGIPKSMEHRQYYSNLYKGKPHGHRTFNGHIPWNKGTPRPPEMIDKGLATKAKNGKPNLGNLNRTPEAKAQAQKKRLATLHDKTPDQKAEMQAKRLATRAANRSVNPPKWATRYNACIECGTITSRHIAYGLCEACYTRYRRRSQ